MTIRAMNLRRTLEAILAGAASWINQKSKRAASVSRCAAALISLNLAKMVKEALKRTKEVVAAKVHRVKRSSQDRRSSRWRSQIHRVARMTIKLTPTHQNRKTDLQAQTNRRKPNNQTLSSPKKEAKPATAATPAPSAPASRWNHQTK